jgi:hypothetical protein
LEQSRYQAQLATRRYEAVDPDNRLVAAELEARWNAALEEVRRLEQAVQRFDAVVCAAPVADRDTLVSLAQDLPAVWNSATTDMALKQRIVRILIQEVVADVDEQNSETVLLIHWAGGRHSELRVKRNGTGKHGRCTSLEAVEVVRRMAGVFRDDQIAATLNRLGLQTGAGNTWREGRVRTLRSYHGFPAYDPAHADHRTLTLEQAAGRLHVAIKTMRRLIDEKVVVATQDEHGNVKEPVNHDKVAIAQLFMSYRDAGLLRPSDPKLQLYWAARRNETVELTPRGREYWWLVVNDKI